MLVKETNIGDLDQNGIVFIDDFDMLNQADDQFLNFMKRKETLMGSFRKMTEKKIKNKEKRKGYINLFETAF